MVFSLMMKCGFYFPVIFWGHSVPLNILKNGVSFDLVVHAVLRV